MRVAELIGLGCLFLGTFIQLRMDLAMGEALRKIEEGIRVNEALPSKTGLRRRLASYWYMILPPGRAPADAEVAKRISGQIPDHSTRQNVADGISRMLDGYTPRSVTWLILSAGAGTVFWVSLVEWLDASGNTQTKWLASGVLAVMIGLVWVTSRWWWTPREVREESARIRELVRTSPAPSDTGDEHPPRRERLGPPRWARMSALVLVASLGISGQRRRSDGDEKDDRK